MFVLFFLELISQILKDFKGIVVFLLLEQEFSEVGLDSHSQERSGLAVAPVDNMTGQENKLLVVGINWSLLGGVDSHGQVEQSTSDLGSLGLRELNEERQNDFLEVDQLIDQALVFQDFGKFVSCLFFCLDDIFSCFFERDLVFDYIFKKFDGVAGLLIFSCGLGRLHIFG